MPGSHTGISSARFRFSHFAVPIGHVPSTGNALTGSRSPFPARSTAVIRWTKSGASADTSGGRPCVAVTPRRHRHLLQVRERRVDRLEVALHDLRAALAVGLVDRVLDLRDRLLARQDAGDREEAGLHDRVDPAAHARLARHRGRVDRVEADALVDQLLLHLARQLLPDLVGRVGRVQQEDRPLRRVFEHVDPFQELELMARDEPGLRDQIGRPDRTGARAQVGDRRRARLLGVVDEVALRVAVGLLADDLDRVLVGAHRAVGAEAVEHRAS